MSTLHYLYFSDKPLGYVSFWRSHIPLVLKCGHSICEHCVETSLQGQGRVTCPECKELSMCSQPLAKVIQDNQLRAEFPPNLYILGELTALHNIRSGANLSCNLLTQGPTTIAEKQGKNWYPLIFFFFLEARTQETISLKTNYPRTKKLRKAKRKLAVSRTTKLLL